MSLVIRLSGTGKKGERKFRIVVKEKRSKRGGDVIEELGYLEKGDKAKNINKERYNYWLQQGAQPSIAVTKLIEK